jgi:hypothetical protein
MRKARRRALSQKKSGEPRSVADSRPPRMEDASFLNIDLDVRSRRSLAPLAAAWSWANRPLAADGVPDPHWLILNPRRFAEDAETATKRLLRHVADLRGEARKCWRAAHRRVFDIGVQAGGPGHAFEEVRLTAGTLKRIGAAGAQIQVTVYPAEPASRFVIPNRRRGTKAQGNRT